MACLPNSYISCNAETRALRMRHKIFLRLRILLKTDLVSRKHNLQILETRPVATFICTHALGAHQGCGVLLPKAVRSSGARFRLFGLTLEPCWYRKREVEGWNPPFVLSFGWVCGTPHITLCCLHVNFAQPVLALVDGIQGLNERRKAIKLMFSGYHADDLVSLQWVRRNKRRKWWNDSVEVCVVLCVEFICVLQSRCVFLPVTPPCIPNITFLLPCIKQVHLLASLTWRSREDLHRRLLLSSIETKGWIEDPSKHQKQAGRLRFNKTSYVKSKNDRAKRLKILCLQ